MEEYTFWRLANYLVKEENFRILHFSKEKNELWLEASESKHYPLVRLLNYELGWSNWLERDLKLTGMNGESIRKQRAKKNLQILNVYISSYPPVDDYKHLIENLKQFDHTMVQTIILSRDKIQEGLTQLQHVFKEKPIPSFDIQSETTEKIDFLKIDTLQLSAKKDKEEQSIFTFGKPFFTYFFIFLQLFMFLLLEIFGGSKDTSTLIQFGAKYNPLIMNGEWWRFIAPIFLHIGFLHLLMNTFGVYYLGSVVERIYGSLRFFWIYLFAGIIGTIASFVFSPSLSAGASGAIYGCFGAFLYLGLIYPKLFFRTLGPNVIGILVLNIAISFTFPSIDIAGHFGGLVGGFIGTGMVHFPRRKKWFSQLIFILFGTLLTISLLYFGFNKPIQFQTEASILQIAHENIKDEKFEETYTLLSEFEEQSKNLSEDFYFELSYVEIQLGKIEKAEDHLKKVIDINGNYDEAHFNLALILLQKEDFETAKQHIKKAVELEPSNQRYEELWNELNE